MTAHTTADWLVTFERLDIPSQPVRLPDDLMTDPHLNDVDFFKPNFSHPTPIHRALRQAVTMDGVDVVPDLPPPLLGADTADLLRAAGCSEEVIHATSPHRGKP